MAMFPIFMIGLIVGLITGWACTNTYYVHKQDMPSDAKIHIQEARIMTLENDIEALEIENKRLNEKLLKKKQTRPKKFDAEKVMTKK